MYEALTHLKEKKLHNYHFMPAAIEYTNYGGLGCFVRYKRPTSDRIVVRHMTANKALIECPDRNLLLIRDTYDQMCYKPAEGVWDKYVPFSLQNANAMEDAELPFYMMNYTDYIQNPHNKSPMLRKHRERLPNESYVVSDSGGFQFMMGRFDWIDPLQLVSWYNDNVDLGMVLDIPTSGITNIEDHLLMATAQKRNTDLMLANKRDSLEFFNIFHGIDEFGDKYHDIVYDERIDRLAIGGVYIGSYMSSLERIFMQVKKLSHLYKHIHFLGTWNLMQLIPIMRFASHGVVELLTSDASSATLAANSKTYMYQQTIDSKWESRSIGLASKCYTPSPHVHLPCTCPVCETIKYQDVFAVLGGAMVTHMLAHHNMHVMNNYTLRMQDIVAREDIQTLGTLMECQLGSRVGIKEAITGIRFADELAAAKGDNGLREVAKKYSMYLSYEDGDDTQHKSLFEDGNPLPADDAPEADVERKLAIARRYLSGETGEHGKENKLKKKKVVATAKASKRKGIKK